MLDNVMTAALSFPTVSESGEAPMSGPDLKRRRREAGIQQGALALEMGRSRQSLWTLENAAEVDRPTRERYLRSLETLATALRR